MENYTQQKARHTTELNAFNGVFYAFDKKQFEDGMRKVGLAPDDTKSVYSLGAGGFIRGDRRQAYTDLLTRMTTERKQLLQDETKLFGALVYELNNHEFCITGDPTDALAALGLDAGDVDRNLLTKAMRTADGRF